MCLRHRDVGHQHADHVGRAEPADRSVVADRLIDPAIEHREIGRDVERLSRGHRRRTASNLHATGGETAGAVHRHVVVGTDHLDLRQREARREHCQAREERGLVGGEQTGATRGCELDRQRQAVQVAAHL